MSQHEMINRAAPVGEIDRTGRILEGLVFRWDHPSQVADRGGPTYLEEFAPTSADRTIGIQRSWPLGILHPWSPGARTSPVPTGGVTFHRTAEGLAFTATVARSARGDEALELLDVGGLGDVSVSARILRSSRRMSPRGSVVHRREEIAIRELSLAPPGMGLHEGAKVLAVRAEQPAESAEQGTPRLDAFKRRRRRLSV